MRAVSESGEVLTRIKSQFPLKTHFRDSRHHRVIAEGVAEVQPSGAESPKKGEQ
jgi:hypothetical protein